MGRKAAKWRGSEKVKEERGVLQIIPKRKANWLGHVLRGNSLEDGDFDSRRNNGTVKKKREQYL